MGRLVQQSAAARAHRLHSTSRVRSGLLSKSTEPGHGGLTHEIESPDNPGRFNRRKIDEYSGRGTLGGWVRMLAVRAAIDLRRRRGERVPDLRDAQRAAVDPELGYLSQRYRGEVENAFRHALTLLDGEQRTLLRMHFVDAVTLDELGATPGILAPSDGPGVDL